MGCLDVSLPVLVRCTCQILKILSHATPLPLPRYTHTVQNRPLAIFLTMLISFQAVYGGLDGAVVLCLGGGHEHEQSETPGLCELACGHENVITGPVSTDQHGDDCACVDIEVELVELLSLPRVDCDSMQSIFAQPTPAWIVAELGHGLSWTGPPAMPHWFDPSGSQRLAIVSSTRLIL